MIQAPASLLDRTSDPAAILPMVANEDACYLALDEFLFEARPKLEPTYQTLHAPVRRVFNSR